MQAPYLDNSTSSSSFTSLSSGTAGSPKYAFNSFTRAHLVGCNSFDYHDAASSNDVNALRQTLKSFGKAYIAKMFTNIPDASGRTSLHWAAERGSVSAVTLLLEYGASSLKVDSMGRNALTVAVNEGKEDCVIAMIDSLAKSPLDLVRAVNCVDCTGYSALALARKKGYDSIGSLLVKNGADVASSATRTALAAKAAGRWTTFMRRRVARRKRIEATRLMLSNVSVRDGKVSFNEEVRTLDRQKSGGIRKQRSIGRTRTMDKALLSRAISAAAKEISIAVNASDVPAY